VLDWFDHPEPGDYWTSLDVSKKLGSISIPALHFSGWYDTYVEGSVDGFVALSQNAGSKFARDNQYLIAGPWQHIPWGDRIGAADFGPDALLDTDAILLRWFNHWLKNSEEFAGEAKICHFVMGENAWHRAGTFPERADRVLYLHSAKRANSRKGDGAMTALAPESNEPADIFVYDPEVPVLAPGGPAALSGPIDQSILELGNNLLVYTTEPLPRRSWIFGKPRVVLFTATSSSNTDFTAKLLRVRPDGSAEFICIGIARSSYLFAATGYAANKVHRWEFDLAPTSCCVAAGDRIRLEIASSAFPLYDRNPGTDVPSCSATSWDWQRSTQIVHHDREHPSALYLPLREGAP
jgi:putative CocE/NonD family hydrolase